jgi:hypothetical protein
VQLDRVGGHSRLAVRNVEEPDPVMFALPLRSVKWLDRALAIFPFFGELEAPLQVASGNSTIIVSVAPAGLQVSCDVVE